jgi:hypothetical protein
MTREEDFKEAVREHVGVLVDDPKDLDEWVNRFEDKPELLEQYDHDTVEAIGWLRGAAAARGTTVLRFVDDVLPEER